MKEREKDKPDGVYIAKQIAQWVLSELTQSHSPAKKRIYTKIQKREAGHQEREDKD